MDRRDQINGEITALKSLLTNSDYQLFKLVENMADCTTIEDLVALFGTFLADFGPLVANRRSWRAQINELEAELNAPDEPAEE